MWRVQNKAAILLVPALLAFALPAGALDELKALKGSYNAQDYRKAVEYGESYIRKQPDDAEARYYLANSYVQLKQMSLAETQYRRCIELAPGSRLAENSQSALSSISRYLTPPQKTQPTTNKNKHGKNRTFSGSPGDERIMNEAQDRIQVKEREANEQIARIRLQAKTDLASVPKRGWRRRRNPGYAVAKAELNAQADGEISRIKRTLANEKRDILNEAERRTSGSSR
jgi:tetratricopeptide (TPR) repeat protein